jgi:hypothetical protein
MSKIREWLNKSGHMHTVGNCTAIRRTRPRITDLKGMLMMYGYVRQIWEKQKLNKWQPDGFLIILSPSKSWTFREQGIHFIHSIQHTAVIPVFVG